MSEKVLMKWLEEARDKMPDKRDKAIVSQVIGFCIGKQMQKKKTPVVSVAQLKEICQELYTKATDVHPTAQDLLKAVRLQVKKEAKAKNK